MGTVVLKRWDTSHRRSTVHERENIYQDSTARMQMECYEQVIRDIVYHPMIEYPLELPEAMVVYPKLCECHLSEQVRKAPQK